MGKASLTQTEYVSNPFQFIISIGILILKGRFAAEIIIWKSIV